MLKYTEKKTASDSFRFSVIGFGGLCAICGLISDSEKSKALSNQKGKSSERKRIGDASSGTAADVAGEDLLSEDSPDSAAASAVRATVPTLLQPRVVVYDGVLSSLPQRG
ncbi:hypothetical protein U1Q18_024898 [Sarracenia purpurea var. burkii]